MNYNELKSWYESLTPTSLDNIDQYYTEEAYFKDPFNEFSSRNKIKDIFLHMFENSENPYFKFIDVVEAKDSLFITWDFFLTIKGSEYKIHGSSFLKISDDKKIYYHRDYWDVGEELLLKIPIIKTFYSALRSKFKV